jgi:O-antigen ligase
VDARARLLVSPARPAERVAEGALLAATLAAPWPFGGAPDPARYALCAAALGAAALASLARRETAVLTLRLGQSAALLPAWGLLQAALGRGAGWPASAEAALVLAAMLAVLVFWSGRGQDPRAADRLLASVLLACAAQAVFGVVQGALAPRRVYGRASELVTAPFGSFVNHNHFAGLVEMGAVLAAGLAAARVRRDGTRPAALALLGLALALVLAHLASGSRGGFLALLAGLGALAAAHAGRGGRSRRRAALAGAAGLFALLAAGLALAPDTARARLATLVSGRPDASASYRVEAARATLRLLAAHPVAGAGLGAFADTVTAWKSVHGEVRLTHAESDALELAAETGLVGLALLGVLAAAWWRGLRERLRRGRDPYRRDVAVAAACAAGALLVHSLFDFGLRLPALALVCSSLLGLAAAPPRDAPRRVRRRIARLGTAGVLVVLAFACAWRAEGARALDRARGLRDASTRAQALGALIARHPYLPEAWRERAVAVGGLTSAGGALHPARAARAADDLTRALVLRPSWAEAWADLAWVRQAGGDTAGSRRALGRARALDPTHLTMGLQNAELVFRLDGPEAAVAEIARLRAANPAWNPLEAVRRAERFTQDPALLAGLSRK